MGLFSKSEREIEEEKQQSIMDKCKHPIEYRQAVGVQAGAFAPRAMIVCVKCFKTLSYRGVNSGDDRT